MKYAIVFLLLLFACSLSANDGAFFAEGNQLVPIGETDITVKKEILTIKRKDAKQVEVTVYYEFYNPQKEKKMIVGFEAAAPSGDVNGMPRNGKHPYIYDFTVDMNNTILPHKVALVEDSVYYKNGTIKSIQLTDEYQCDNYCEFYYVYHFDATFKKGLNIVKHTYTFDLSGGVIYNYYFHYVLTAAMRWGNKQIDDFTLIIDMGEQQDFYIQNTSFGDWIATGIGKTIKNVALPYQGLAPTGGKDENIYEHFYIRNGQIIFQKKNFKPQSELTLFSLRSDGYWQETFDYKKMETLPIYYPGFTEAVDDTSRKILRNYPFARRGYVFSSSELKEYYNNQPWYIADPNYTGTMETLSEEETKWVDRWSN